jgi:hypothetical protein
MFMVTGIGPGQEYEKRMRKAHFWIGLGRRARLAFVALFGLIILTIITAGLLSVSGISVSPRLFGDIMFALIGLLIFSSSVIIVSSFLRNLYQPGNPCDLCNCPPTNCPECVYQKLTGLDSKKDR